MKGETLHDHEDVFLHFDSLNWYQEVVFSWLNPLIQLGTQRPLEFTDIGHISHSLKCQVIATAVKEKWDEQVSSSAKPSLWTAIFFAFPRENMLTIGNATLYVVVACLQPLLIKRLMNFIVIENHQGSDIRNGIILVGILGVTSFLNIFTLNATLYYMIKFGISARSAIISLMFRKSFRLSNAARTSLGTGEIITLMSVDSERVRFTLMMWFWLILSPVLLIIAMGMMVAEVGYPGLFSGVALLLWMALQDYISRLIGRARSEVVKFTDARVKSTNEMLQGIRMIKLYAWEEPLANRINDIREKETIVLRRYQMLKMSGSLFMNAGPVLLAAVVFLSLVAMKRTPFSVAQVYTVLAILNILRLPLAMYPQARSAHSEAVRSFKRIQHLLTLPEADDVPSLLPVSCPDEEDRGAIAYGEIKGKTSTLNALHNAHTGHHSNGSGGSEDVLVRIENGCFDWNSDASTSPGTSNPPYSLQTTLMSSAQQPSASSKKDFFFTKKNTIKNKSIKKKGDHIELVEQEGEGGSSAVTEPPHPNSDMDTDTTTTTITGVSLQDINLTIRRGELVAVIGAVGQGKSSLVGAMMGHIHRVSGEQSLRGRVAYVSQEHWIQNSTLCDNVLFEAPLVEKQYGTVIDASQLTPDLLALPFADHTQIGERGITLSGGQKARVSVARALYSDEGLADLYIFDDPLSAVDVYVGKRIFHDAILTSLRDRARVVVLSSNYHLLNHFDKIIVMESGKAVCCDGYRDLVKRYPKYGIKQTDNDEYGNLSHKWGGDITASNHHIPPEQSGYASLKHVIESKRSAGELSSTDLRAEGALTDNTAATTASLQSSGQKEEDRERGSVSMKVFIAYISAAFRIPENTLHYDDHPKVSHRSFSSSSITSITAPRDSPTRKIDSKERNDSSFSPMTSPSHNKSKHRKDHSTQRRGLLAIFILFILFSIGQALRILADLWLGLWAVDTDRGNESNPNHSTGFYTVWYIAIVAGLIFFTIVRSYYFMDICVRVSATLHKELLQFVLRAPVNLYFDITPLGRILNRFSSDLDSMDGPLPEFFHYLIQNTFQVASILVVCIASTPYFLIMLAPLGVFFGYLFSYFRQVSREVKRMNSVSRSPVFSLFTDMLRGVHTLRAFGREEQLLQHQYERVDNNNKFLYVYWAMSRWLALRLDVIAVVVIITIAFIAVIVSGIGGGAVNPNMLGLALVNALQMTTLLQWMVRAGIDTETNMTSVERLLAFSDIEPEAPTATKNDPALDVWPSAGAIEFKNVSMRYRPGLNLVLKNLNLSIAGGSKVGVIGRTGSGKSSLMSTLFRIAEPESGSIISVDGVNILNIGLYALRSRLTIIPQDPIMFAASLRYNIDPFSQYSDMEVWEALERAHMKKEVENTFPSGLEHQISEGGDNISAGQKQLLCIARALLRRSLVIILDEATASIDSFTDSIIQQTIREEFSRCTVLTIAHRLETIADYDMVVVMESGSIVEKGPPCELLGLSLPEENQLKQEPLQLLQQDQDAEEKQSQSHTMRQTSVMANSVNRSEDTIGSQEYERGVICTGYFKGLVDELGDRRRTAFENIVRKSAQEKKIRSKNKMHE